MLQNVKTLNLQRERAFEERRLCLLLERKEQTERNKENDLGMGQCG
jgi:hypothetical protein